MTVTLGTLELGPLDLSLLADPVARALAAFPDVAAQAHTVAIDPDMADTTALASEHGIPPEVSANCVVVLGKRGGEQRPAACVVLAHTRADVNGLVRRTIDVRKLSFAPQDWAVSETGMDPGRGSYLTTHSRPRAGARPGPAARFARQRFPRASRLVQIAAAYP